MLDGCAPVFYTGFDIKLSQQYQICMNSVHSKATANLDVELLVIYKE
jgi:hypothetical protein